MDNTFSSLKEAITGLLPEKRFALLNYLAEHVDLDQLLDVDLVKVLKQQQDTHSCPHCHSQKIGDWGAYKERKRFKCCNCNKTFNELCVVCFT